eukprot:scaffold64089_cov48-Phaeocystis_antarctica.AAC.2
MPGILLASAVRSSSPAMAGPRSGVPAAPCPVSAWCSSGCCCCCGGGGSAPAITASAAATSAATTSAAATSAAATSAAENAMAAPVACHRLNSRSMFSLRCPESQTARSKYDRCITNRHAHEVARADPTTTDLGI